MKNSFLSFLSISLFSVLIHPVSVFANNHVGDGQVLGLLLYVMDIINVLTVIAFALILLVFFWGLAKYVYKAGSETERAEGKSIMVGGVIALFVAASIWGIITFIQGELGIEDNLTPPGGGADCIIHLLGVCILEA